jgi:hypothetical protein
VVEVDLEELVLREIPRETKIVSIENNPEETPEQQQANAMCHAWKRNITNPPRPNDIDTISALWTGALNILNDDDRDWKQQLPRDLDFDEYHGREHIGSLMNMKVHKGGCFTFVELVQPFLFITYQAFLNCLAVDTAVGNLYKYIGGSNGKSANSFFQRVCMTSIDTQLEGDSSGSTVMLERHNICSAHVKNLNGKPRNHTSTQLPEHTQSAYRAS